jgi:hypothetical protein
LQDTRAHQVTHFASVQEALSAAADIVGARASFPLGDMVKKATGALGIRPCGGCERRRIALNAISPEKTRYK